MKRDAHFYAILGFARACGFRKESAYTIAYASQFVDDAKINHITIKNPQNITYDIIENQPSFFNMATCHSYFRINTFNYNSMTNNTVAFHFVPGCKGESFPKKLRCSEESKVIKNILNEVLHQNDLVKFGMVLHPYADTFSHQGFSGLLSKVNDIKNVKLYSKKPRTFNIKSIVLDLIMESKKDKFDKLLDKAMPAYGHGQALECPDWPHLIWSYEYDYSDEFSGKYKASGMIDNRKRFKRAFEKIMGYLRKYLENHHEHKDPDLKFDNFDILFNTLIKRKDDSEREKIWRKVLAEENLFSKFDPELYYDENKWLKESFENFEEKNFNQRKVDNATLRDNFIDTNWYKFYLAVKWYKEKFFHYCQQEGLDIPQ